MASVWRVVYGAKSIRTAQQILFFVGPIFAFWTLLIVIAGGSTFGLFMFGLLASVNALLVWKSANVRVETGPHGVLVVNTWGKEFVPWDRITDINVTHKNIVSQDSEGNLNPPPQEWQRLLDHDGTLLLFDMVRGPQRIVGIGLVVDNGSIFYVDAIGRNTLNALSEGKRYWMNTTSDKPYGF